MKDIPESEAPSNAEAAGDPIEEQALPFLQALVGDAGPFALTEISPGDDDDDDSIASKTGVLPEHRAEAADYLRQRAGAVNLYYMPNAAKPKKEWAGRRENRPAAKARKADVIGIRAVWLDLDPRGGADDFDAERARLRELVERLQGHPICPPSAVIDSGNGFQLVWFLAEVIEATPESIATAEAQGKALALHFGGDHTQNVDRILRIPGTWNYPDAGKRAKGRVKHPTRLLHLDPAARYTLEGLAELAPPDAVGAGEAKAIDLEGFDYEAVLEAAHEGEKSLAEHLRSFVEAERVALDAVIRRNAHDRSGCDFGLLAYCIERGVNDPTEAWQVTAALAPERLLDSDKGGVRYALRTIRNALKDVEPLRPRPRPEDYFSPVTPELGFPATPARSGGLIMHTVSGLSSVGPLPRRERLLSPRLPLGDVVQLVGPPAASKSTLALRDALIVAGGRRDLLAPNERLFETGPVIIYNAEDRAVEMKKRLVAALRYFHAADPLPHKIHLISGTEQEMTIMCRAADARGRQGPLLRAVGADVLEAHIRETGAKLVILDPQVDLARGASENDNDDMNALLQELMRIAARNRVCIVVVHHTSKAGRDSIGDMGAGRGAFASIAKVRAGFGMLKVTGRDERERAWRDALPGAKLVRLDYSKVSHDEEPTEPAVYYVRSVAVGNGEGGTPRDASELFDSDDPAEALRLRGDYAPVLDLVDHKALESQAAAGGRQPDEAKKQAVARIVFRMMDGAGEVDLASIAPACGECMRDEKITTAKSRPMIMGTLTAALIGGAVIEHAGQVVRVNAAKRGNGPTAPWIAEARRVDAG